MIATGASKTGITVSFTGIDNTASTFRGIAGKINTLQKVAGGFSAKLGTFARLAPVAAVAYGFKQLAGSVAETWKELSNLSDRAADAGTTSPALQKLTGAMRQLGVRGASLETVSQAMQRMTRMTGEVGAEGFAKVLGQASRLENEAERLDFLSKAFGRQQGMVFASIVRGGDDAIAKFVELAAEYPAVSDAAAMAGDRAADAMSRAADAIKAGWGEMCTQLVFWMESVFGPLPEAAAKAARGVMYALKAIGVTIRTITLAVRILIEPIVRTVASLIETISNLRRAATEAGYSLRDAFSDSWQGAKDQFTDMWEGWTDTASDIFDFSNIGAERETKPIFDGMREAISEGGVTFRKEAERANKGLTNTFKGGTWALEGSAEARRIIAGDSTRSGQDAANRAVTSHMQAIVDTLRSIADSTLDTSDYLSELEAI